MATILRVKRKKEDEPLDALLIECKRQKVDSDENSAPLTTIVKFAGTVQKQDDNVVEHITKNVNKDILKANYKQHIVDITKKVREKTKQESSENRYKIVNSMRSLNTSLTEQSEEDKINIIDIEDTNAVLDDKSFDEYVYDLYYTQTKEEILLDNLVSVLPIEQELVFEDHYRDNDGGDDCSEDSNSESNWRNDYPDSDSNHSNGSIGENDIMNAIKNLNVEDDLSSDGEDFVYGLDEDDVNQYGYKYAKYKARMKKEEEDYDNEISIDSDEESGSEKDDCDKEHSDDE